jgi:isoamylase
VEGPTDARRITELRERQKRNMLATLLLSQGIPMICGGDEIGHTQRGNNNAYCQDNDISWFDWTLTKAQQALFDFTKSLITLRQRHPVFRRRRFFQGRRIRGAKVKDISWFRPDGKEMTDEDWTQGYVRCLGIRLAGDAIEEADPQGQAIVDETFLVLLNAHHEPLPFILPAHKRGVRWQPLLDTALSRDRQKQVTILKGGECYDLEARSLAVLLLRQKLSLER